MLVVTAMLLGRQHHHVEMLSEVPWMRHQGSLLGPPSAGVWAQLWLEQAQPLLSPRHACPPNADDSPPGNSGAHSPGQSALGAAGNLLDPELT